MAAIIDNETIDNLASLIGASGKAGLFGNADSFKCNVNDKLNVHDDFAAALVLRGNNVDIEALLSATPSNAAKTERTALFGSFKRAARKVNGIESDYRLSSATLKPIDAVPAKGDTPAIDAVPARTVLCIVRVK